MKSFILTKVHSTSVASDPKDLEKGLGFIVVLEATKKIGDVVVPDFIKCKSAVKLEPGEHLLEVVIYNIGSPTGGKVQTYYHIIRKSDFGGKK
jgi:hypothetical protein